MTDSYSVFCFLMHAWTAVVRDRQERLQLKLSVKAMSLFHSLGNSLFKELGCSEKCHEHYKIESSASGTMNNLYSPLKGR